MKNKLPYNYLIFAFLFCNFFLSGQKQITKVVIDSKTKFPIDYVFISSNDKKVGLLTNKKGKFSFIASSNINTFSFYKLGFKSSTLSYESVIKQDTIFLTENFTLLEEVSVTSDKVIPVVKDKRFYINDYFVLPDNNFLILTSKINIKGFEIAIYNEAKGIIYSKKIKDEEGEFLFKDCFGSIQLITNQSARQIYFESDTSFNFLQKYTRSKFDNELLNVVLKLDTEVIIKSSLPPKKMVGVYFDAKVNSPFVVFNKVGNGKVIKFYTLQFNKQLLEMFANEKADSKMVVGSGQKVESTLLLFYEQIAKEIYAPMFLKNDTVIIFNFQQNEMAFLNKAGEELLTKKIDQKGFSQFHNFEILYDKERQKFYLKIRDSDKFIIKELNIYTGTFGEHIKLEKTFAKKIQIINGKMFYLVNEKEWDDTSYIYLQRL